MSATRNITGPQMRSLRLRIGINQSDFWRCFGVSQCTGSHYELGRRMPRPLRVLLGEVLYGDRIGLPKGGGVVHRYESGRAIVWPEPRHWNRGR